MNPALDALVHLDHAPKGEGEIFKDVTDCENAGGKALNVARWLAIRGDEVACGGLLGIDNAAPFEKELAKYHIRDCFLRVAGSTRRNEMITWQGGAFKVNRTCFADIPSPSPDAVLAGSEDADWVVIAGSLPQCCPPTFYADCIALLKRRGQKVALDASGPSLSLGVKCNPDLIKPNAEECEPLISFVPHTAEEFKRATELLLEQCGEVIISDGGNGAWFNGQFVKAPKVEVVDTTSAGDTLLAEWCHSHDAELAVAAGSAACTMPGSTPPPISRVLGQK